MDRDRNHTSRAVRLDWEASVSDVIAAWPAHLPMAALVSGQTHNRWSRWSILGASTGIITDWSGLEKALDRKPDAHRPLPRLCLTDRLDVPGDTTLDGGTGVSPVIGDSVTGETPVPLIRQTEPNDEPPFASGVIGWINYDAGFEFEPTARRAGSKTVDDRNWPMACLHRCEAAYVHDRLHDQWWATGDVSKLPEIEFFEPDVVPGSMTGETPVPPVARTVASMSRAEYESSVERVIEYIRAGDIFQANISRRLTSEYSGSIRDLALQLFDAMGPWYGALVEGPTPGRAVLSMSPELFVEVQPGTRRITTRPIKGTAPVQTSPTELANSEKDRAELVMIVDLMRNDLGRICEFGSIRVAEAQAIERHGGIGSCAERGVLHGVATVLGRLRDDVSAMDVLRATFPAGSITGAPKIRAMQIIDEIEPIRRGPYCGAVGWFDDRGGMAMNVAIRTASVVGEPTNERWDQAIGAVDYSVGAGIVADSEPAKEWDEIQAKAAGFLSALQSLRASSPVSEVVVS